MSLPTMDEVRSLGISGKFLRILISMYTKASARIKLSSQQATEPFACQKGVRQGCKLSPLLFSLFISGLEIELARNKAGVEVHDNHLDVLMFADDIVMFSTSPMGLQKQLDTLEQFCCRWKLKINIDKTKICVYGSAKEQSFTCCGTHLDNADSYKYLGIWISRDAKFSKAREYIRNKVKTGTFTLKQSLLKLKSPPTPVAIQLFNTITMPMLCYGSEIWGFYEDKEVERTVLQYFKYILGLPGNATNIAVRGEVGQFPIHLYWIENIIKYWCRVSKTDLPIYVQKATMVQQQMRLDNKKCWLVRTKTIYDAAGLSYKFNLAISENVDDHLLCHCKRNATLRVKIFTDVTHRYASFAWLLPNEKLVFLMSSEDPQVLQTTAEFIYKSFLMMN